MKTVDLGSIVLDAGDHTGPDDGMCLMEAVAWIADEPWSDRPACVSVVLADFGRSLDHALPDDLRQRLVPLIPALIGTRGDGLDEARGYLAWDWLVRTWTPAWLDVAGLSAEASALRDLRRIVDVSAAGAAGPVVREARAKAAAAGAAAGDAAWAAGAAAGDAWAAARAAGAAARDAARAALAPTATQLQESAIDLFARMIRPGGDA